MPRYLEQVNECTDPTAGDLLWIYDASAGSTDRDRKLSISRLAILANAQTFTGGQTFAPTAGTTAIAVTTPANQTVGALTIGAADCGSSYGPHIVINRNSNASTPAAGWIQVVNRGNTAYALWVDASGNVRVGTSTPSSANDTSGTVCGTQTSSLDTKDVIGEFVDNDLALDIILSTPLYDFTYKSGAFNGEKFTGVITDYAPVFGMDCDTDHPHGKSLNEINAHGYAMAAIKALNAKIESQSAEIQSLRELIASMS